MHLSCSKSSHVHSKKGFLSLSNLFVIWLAACALTAIVTWHRFASMYLMHGRQDSHDPRGKVVLDATTDSGDLGAKRLPFGNSPHRLLIASHGRLFWYYYKTNQVHVLHEGEGVHYGIIPGKTNQSVWNIIRPHNWHPTSSEEFLVELDVFSGDEIRRVKIPSRFTHDAVVRGDTVYICNTGEGHVLELHYPSMKIKRSTGLFTLHDHVNTLAPLEDGTVWAVLHNLGKSDVVKVDMQRSPPRVVLRIKNVGDKAHGLVLWEHQFVMLDSENGGLILMDPTDGTVEELWQVPEGGKFLKGLAVIDDVAYFGISVWAQRKDRTDPDRDSELAAFDLIEQRLLWRRVIPTKGLLNIIAAPHLGAHSTYKGAYTHTLLPGGLVTALSEPLTAAARKQLAPYGFPVKFDGYWSSGWPHMSVKVKQTKRPWEAGLQLPLFHVDVTAVQEKLLNMPEAFWSQDYQQQFNAFIDGRDANMKTFKPGVDAIMLIFSDNSGNHVYRFPFYYYFADVLEPILAEILGEDDTRNIIRLQLARMKPEVEIKMHQDAGGYAGLAHRIHVPLFTHEDVSFHVCIPGLSEMMSLQETDQLAELTKLEAEGKLSGYQQALLKQLREASQQDVRTTVAPPSNLFAHKEVLEGVLSAAGMRATPELLQQLSLAAGGTKDSSSDEGSEGAPAVVGAPSSGQLGSSGALTPEQLDELHADEYFEEDEDEHISDHRHRHHAMHRGHVPRPQEMAQGQPMVVERNMPLAGAVTLGAHTRKLHGSVEHLMLGADGAMVGTSGSRTPVRRSLRTTGVEKPHKGYEQKEEDCVKIPTSDGLVFELNNKIPHKVVNHSPYPRIHLVVDVVTEPKRTYDLKQGTNCNYERGVIVCPPGTVMDQ